MKELQDFIVIGGGPSGSTIATQLARKGYSVTVFEKEKFPREHIGESLLPFCHPMLEDMGILDEMKKYAVRKPGVMFISADGSKKNTYCFDKVIHNESALSFHVHRSFFDDLMLKNSRKFGANVQEETKVVHVELNRDDKTVKVDVKGKDGITKSHYAKQLIDASGQDTFLSKKMKSKKAIEGLHRTAVATHWVLESMPEKVKVGIQPVVYIGGEKKGWIFIIPVGYNRISVGVVVSNQYIKTEKTKLINSGVEDWKSTFYHKELKESPYVVDLLKSAKLIDGFPLNLMGDYSYYSETKFGDNFVMAGDSAAFLDPIFSSGIYLSMKSSYLLADAFDKKMKGGDMTDNTAIAEVYKNIDGAYDLMAKFIHYFYNAKALNLAELDSDNMNLGDHINHESSFKLMHYLLAGDFFEEHERYGEMIDMLQEPKHYLRFKNLSIDKRKDIHASSCGYETSDIYSKELIDKFMATPH